MYVGGWVPRTPSLNWISRREITFQCSRHNVFHRRPEIVNGGQAQASMQQNPRHYTLYTIHYNSYKRSV